MVPMAEAITAVVEAAITAAALAAGEATEMVAVTAAAVAEMGIVAAMEVGTAAATAEEDANESRPDLHAPCNAWPDGSCARNIGML
jgi:hypothetical protein